MSRATVPRDTAVVVHYPGYVQDVDAALDSMGGLVGIAASHAAHDREPLQVKCRPRDSLSHPLFAERVRGRALLLKVAQSRNHGDSDESQAVQAEVVARVNVSYNFAGIADFQYLSTTRVTGSSCGGNTAAATHVDLPKSTVAEAVAMKGAAGMNLPSAAGPFGEEREVLEVVPPLFTRQDYEFGYGFRPNVLPTSEQSLPVARSRDRTATRAIPATPPASNAATASTVALPAQQPPTDPDAVVDDSLPTASLPTGTEQGPTRLHQGQLQLAQKQQDRGSQQQVQQPHQTQEELSHHAAQDGSLSDADVTPMSIDNP